MSSVPLHFKKLSVDRMYGVRHGLQVGGLATGVNVIYGPNAVGKSTLARALSVLLWPDLDGDVRSFVSAQFEIDGMEWRADLEAGRIVYQRNGIHADSPRLPVSDHRDRYQLSLPELLRADNKKFAKAVMQEAVGGIDVEAAARSLGFSKPFPSRGKATEHADRTYQRIATENQKQLTLDRDRKRLSESRKELEQAKLALRRADFLDVALEYVRARDGRTELEIVRRQYPEVLAKLTVEDPRDVKAWRLKLESARGARREAHASLERLHDDLDRSIIPANGLEDGFLERLDERVREIERESDLVRQLENELAGACEREEAAWRQIKGRTDAEQASGIDVEVIRELADFGHEAEKFRSRRSARTALEALLDGENEHVAPDVLKDAARQLQRWLAAAHSEKGPSSSLRPVLLVAAVVILALAVFLGMAWSPLGYGLILLDVLLGYVWYKLRGPGSDTSRETYRRDYPSTAVAEPETWDIDGVEVRLSTLYQEIADAHVAHLKADKLKEVRNLDPDLARQGAKLQALREEFAKEIGIEPDPENEEIFYLVERIAQWQKARLEVQEKSLRLDGAKTSVGEALSALHRDTGTFDFGMPESGAEAVQQVTKLRSAAGIFGELKRDLREATDAGRRADETIDELSSNIRAVFDRAGLELDDDAGLDRLCGLLEGHRKAGEELRYAAAVEDDRKRRAESHALYDESVLALPVESIEHLLEESREAGSRAEELKEYLTSMATMIGEAERGHALEQARAEHEEALRALDEDRRKNFRSLAGWLVGEYVQERTKDRQLPPVFRRARALFAEITSHRYELRFDGEAFFAYDTVREHGLALEKLSSGTRVQLLLSVRIAFLEEQEQGMRLPLVLDETLANSDDGKAKAIIDAILRISASGRQVFYFTCQDDEVAKWKRIADEQDAVDCSFIPLAGASGISAIEADALPSSSLFRAILEPGDQTHEAYGRELGVEPWGAFHEPGALHLWYLVDDCKLLHHLLKAGFERWGQLRQLASIGDHSIVGVDGKTYARLHVLARALEVWREAWRVGRGRRVDRTVLEASGMVSDKFLDKVSELCDSVSGDARHMIEALRESTIKGFRKDKMDDLEMYFIEHQYIDSAEPLSEQEIWTRTIAAVSEGMGPAEVEIDDVRRLLNRVHEASMGGAPIPATDRMAAKSRAGSQARRDVTDHLS